MSLNILKRYFSSSIFMLALSQPGFAATGSVTPSYDPGTQEMTVELIVSGVASGLSTLEIGMVYQSSSATFVRATVSDASVSAFAGGKAQDQGKVSGSTQATSTDGRLRIDLIFKTQGAGSLSGRFESVKLNGAELGPIQIDSYGFGGAPSSSPNSNEGSSPSSNYSAPSQIAVSGGNRSIHVSWAHPVDATLGYRAEAHVVNGNGVLIPRTARTCRSTPNRMACTLNGLKNQTPYQVIVSAVYPKRVTVHSAPSAPVIPGLIALDGICAPKATRLILRSAITGQGLCLRGTEIQQSAEGPEARWYCAGSGVGTTAVCSGMP
jgi:hypothetical protein